MSGWKSLNTSNYLKKLDNIPCTTCCFCVFVIASAVTVPAWLKKEDTTKLNSANMNSIFGRCGLLRCLRVFLFCHKELIKANASVKVRCSLENETLKLKAKRNSKQAAKIFLGTCLKQSTLLFYHCSTSLNIEVYLLS